MLPRAKEHGRDVHNACRYGRGSIPGSGELRTQWQRCTTAVSYRHATRRHAVRVLASSYETRKPLFAIVDGFLESNTNCQCVWYSPNLGSRRWMSFSLDNNVDSNRAKTLFTMTKFLQVKKAASVLYAPSLPLFGGFNAISAPPNRKSIRSFSRRILDLASFLSVLREIYRHLSKTTLQKMTCKWKGTDLPRRR